MTLRVFTSGFTVAAPAGLSPKYMSSYLQDAEICQSMVESTSKRRGKKKWGPKKVEIYYGARTKKLLLLKYGNK